MSIPFCRMIPVEKLRSLHASSIGEDAMPGKGAVCLSLQSPHYYCLATNCRSHIEEPEA